MLRTKWHVCINKSLLFVRLLGKMTTMYNFKNDWVKRDGKKFSIFIKLIRQIPRKYYALLFHFKIGKFASSNWCPMTSCSLLLLSTVLTIMSIMQTICFVICKYAWQTTSPYHHITISLSSYWAFLARYWTIQDPVPVHGPVIELV